MTHTLNDCGCTAKVYSDESGVDIEFCEMHLNAPARAAELEKNLDLANAHALRLMQERDEARDELQRIRTMLDDGLGDSATALFMVKRLHSQNYELARQLEQAQRKIDAFEKAQKALNEYLNSGAGVYRP